MGEMADNPYLMPSLRRLLIDHARIAQTFYRPRTEVLRQRLRTASQQHEQFIEAIVAGDAARGIALAHDHWALSRDHLDLFVRPDPLPIAPDTALSHS